MQIIRLVEAGRVDKIIAFDSLPKQLLLSVRKKLLDGYPRYWHSWAKEHDSIIEREYLNPETERREKYIEAATYILDFRDINSDKETWQAISNYVRRAVDLSFRLMDKIEDMALALAKDSQSEISIEPEDVPIIPILLQGTQKRLDAPVADVPHETFDKAARKPGRPRKDPIGVES